MRNRKILLGFIVFALLFVFTGCEDARQAREDNAEIKMRTAEIIEVKNWQMSNGFITFEFTEDECKVNDIGFSGNSYSLDYSLIKERNQVFLLLLNKEGEELIRYSLSIVEERDSIYYMTPDIDQEEEGIPDAKYLSIQKDEKGRTQSFEKTNEEYIRLANEESLASLDGDQPRSAMHFYNEHYRWLDECIDGAYYFIKEVLGDEHEYNVDLSTPEKDDTKIYINEAYQFKNLDYDEEIHEVMKFDDLDALYEVLKANKWMIHRFCLNSNTRKIKEGYLDIKPLMPAALMLEFDKGAVIKSIGNIISNEVENSGGFFLLPIEYNNSYVLYIHLNEPDIVEYAGNYYSLTSVYFIDTYGLLVETLALVDEHESEVIFISNSNIYANTNSAIWDYFVPLEYETQKQFSKEIINVWTRLETEPTYNVDINIASLNYRRFDYPYSLEITQDYIDKYAVDVNALFEPDTKQEKVELNGISYTMGYYLSIDSEGRLVVRYALYDAEKDEYKFTAFRWVFEVGAKE